MSINFTSQDTFAIMGSKSGTTRTSATLTNAYDNATTTKIFKTGGWYKMNMDILYTMGAAETSNSIEIRLEGSTDGTNFYRLPNDSTSGGTSTITARELTFLGTNGAAANISFGIDIFYKFMRVSIKETGVASAAGTVFVEVTLSGK